jgi:hypothetical protein
MELGQMEIAFITLLLLPCAAGTALLWMILMSGRVD